MAKGSGLDRRQVAISDRTQRWLLRASDVLLVTGLIAAVLVGDSDEKGDTATSVVGGHSASTDAGPDASGAEGEPTTAGSLVTGTASSGDSRSPRSAGSAAGRGPAGSSPVAQAAASGLLASDRGITPTTIKVGFFLIEVGNLSRLGVAVPGIDAEQQKLAYQIYVDRLNRRGGINGRKVEPVFHKFDVTSHDSMRAACLALAKDEKIFVGVDSGGLWGPAVLCVTDEHQTPFLTTGGSGLPKDWYTRSDGRLFTVFQGGERSMSNFPYELRRLGHLAGRKVGILADLRPGQKETVDVLVAVLRQLGHPVVHRTDLHADFSVGASQVPVEVQQMRTKEVDTVLMVANTVYAAQFAQEATSQLYFPSYFTSDWQNGQTDVYAASMPENFNGSLNITVDRTSEFRVGVPEPTLEAACRQTYEQGSGTKLERGSNEYQATVQICTLVQLLEMAGVRAGINPTRDRFTAAVLGLGEIPLTKLAGGSFKPGKPDAADFVRTQRWESGCRCWKPIDDFRRTHY